MRRWRLLVAWFRFPVAGGIGRFVQVGRVMRRRGHDVSFLALSGDTSTEWPSFPGPILTLEEARAETWDAVMVPGAGARPASLERFAELTSQRFGLRLQFLLSDRTKAEAFAAVNAALRPDVVIAVSSDWNADALHRLPGRAHHVLPGAVDVAVFRPGADRWSRAPGPEWAIGAHGMNNGFESLLGALDLLPRSHVLHLYGDLPADARLDELREQGRIVARGRLFDADLAAFYRSMDVVVTPDRRAGWCNPAAEALACGVPSVVSTAGTADFARHMENAIVMRDVSSATIADNVRTLREDEALRRSLSERAPATMRSWTWERHCDRLLAILERPEAGAL